MTEKEKPNIFIVKREQIKGVDIDNFLRTAIDRQFNSSEYLILTETITETITHYSTSLRKIKGFLVEAAGRQHTIYFDITDATSVDQNKHSWKIYQ